MWFQSLHTQPLLPCLVWLTPLYKNLLLLKAEFHVELLYTSGAQEEVSADLAVAPTFCSSPGLLVGTHGDSPSATPGTGCYIGTPQV